MSQRGHRYGSEYHFIRYRTDHPGVLDSFIRNALPKTASIEWLYPARGVAAEPKDLAFVNFTESQQKQWHAFWPSPGNRSWDGVARSNGEWLLFEAKANEAEPCSPGTSASPESLAQIKRALDEVKLFLGVPVEAAWHREYYQFANRLATLYFLAFVARIPAQLIFLYFTGDEFPDGRPCPQSEQDWKPPIHRCHTELRLPARHKLSERTHEVFVPVAASASQ